MRISWCGHAYIVQKNQIDGVDILENASLKSFPALRNNERKTDILEDASLKSFSALQKMREKRTYSMRRTRFATLNMPELRF